MKRAHSIPLIALIVSVLIATGCGSDDDDQQGTEPTPVATPSAETLAPIQAPGIPGNGPRLSRQQWVNEVEATCAEGSRGAATASAQITEQLQADPTSLSEEETTLRAFELGLPALRESLAKLGTIRPPAGVEKGYRTFLQDIARGLQITRGIAIAVGADDKVKAAELVQLSNEASQRSVVFAAQYGIDGCVLSPQAQR